MACLGLKSYLKPESLIILMSTAAKINTLERNPLENWGAEPRILGCYDHHKIENYW